MGSSLTTARGVLAAIVASIAACTSADDTGTKLERSRPAQASGRDESGWRRLPPAPIDARDGHLAVWTGEEMIVWGGSSFDAVSPEQADGTEGYSFDPSTGTTVLTRQVQFRDGAAYSPRRDAWRVIASAPAGFAPYFAQTVWTGREMLVFGLNEPARATAAAYAPEDDAWREVAPPPYELDFTAATAVWTGDEMIVWGGLTSEGFEGPRRGAAYEPVADRWRLLPGAPIGNRQAHTAVWTGEEMIVWGGDDLVGVRGAEEQTDGAAYRPATDSWRMLPPAPIAGREEHEAVWTGSEMIIWGGDSPSGGGDGAAYDPATDQWRVLAQAPLGGRHWHTWTWVDDAAVASGGYNFFTGEAVFADGASYNVDADRWTPLGPSPLAARCRHSAVWTGDELILWGGTTHCGTHGARDNDGAALTL